VECSGMISLDNHVVTIYVEYKGDLMPWTKWATFKIAIGKYTDNTAIKTPSYQIVFNYSLGSTQTFYEIAKNVHDEIHSELVWQSRLNFLSLMEGCLSSFDAPENTIEYEQNHVTRYLFDNFAAIKICELMEVESFGKLVYPNFGGKIIIAW